MSAIGKHISSWLKNNDLRKSDIVRAMGYSNINGGMRRLNAVMEGKISDRVFMEKLRGALGEAVDDFKLIVNATHKENNEVIKRRIVENKRRATEQELVNRANFKPYMHINHERSCPSPIFVVACTGVERWKHLPLPEEITSLSEIEQLLHIKNVIQEHQASPVKDKGPFGNVAGYDFRRTYDEYIKFDLQGDMQDVCSDRPVIGTVTLQVGNKVVEKMPVIG